MKTEYLILWVDDEVDYEDVANVSEFLEQFGVRPDIRLIQPRAGQDMHALVSPIIEDANLDLIIVDNKMFGENGGLDGNQLIHLIRESDHVYLPVIFYSSGGIEPLMEAAKRQKLDGVYLTVRDLLADKVKTVITSLMRKEQTIKQTRGLLMEGVSEIDAKFGVLFKAVWGILDSGEKAKLIEYFREKIEDQALQSKKAAEKFPSETTLFLQNVISNFVSNHYTTSIRWKVLKKALELANIDREFQNVFQEFHQRPAGKTAIVTLRNNYGHKTRDELSADHSQAICTDIRRELRRQSENLDSIEATLVKKAASSQSTTDG